MSQLVLNEMLIVSDDEEEFTSLFLKQKKNNHDQHLNLALKCLHLPLDHPVQVEIHQVEWEEHQLNEKMNTTTKDREYVTRNAFKNISMSLRSDYGCVSFFSTVEIYLVSHTRYLPSENIKWESITISV